MKNIYTTWFFIIGFLVSHSFLTAMLPALRKNVRAVPTTASSPFLPRRTMVTQPPKRFAPELPPLYAMPIEGRKTSAPPVEKKSFWGYLLSFLGLGALATSDNQEAKEEAQITHFLELVENKDPQAISTISQFLVSASMPLKQKLFDMLTQKASGYTILLQAINTTTEMPPIITSLISEHNIPHLYRTFDGRNLIAKIMEKDQQARNRFADLAENKLFSLATSTSGSNFVSNIIELQPTIAPKILSRMIQANSIPSLRIFNSAIRHTPYDKTMADYLKNHYNPDNLSSILALLIFNQAHPDPAYRIDIVPPTQSIKHLSDNIEQIANSPLINEIIERPEIAQLATKALAQEKNIAADNAVLFYHGQSHEYSFLQDLYALLYETKYGIAPGKEFVFINLHEPITDQTDLQKEEMIRKQLITNDPQDRWKKNIQGHRLFVTAALFANSKEPDLNPLFYVIKNKGTNEVKISPADIFTMFGYTHLYDGVKNDIEQLYQEHTAMSPFGQLLQIEVPKNKLADYVYSAGNKSEHEAVLINNNGKKEMTFDIQKIMDNFPHNLPDSDNKEFVLATVASKNGPGDPHGPFKIIAYDAAPQDKKQKYEEKKSTVFTAIQKAAKK